MSRRSRSAFPSLSSRRSRRPWWLVLLILAIGWVYNYYFGQQEPGEDVVIRVSDGDTIKLQRTGTVRLIGVDCPEKTQEGGQEAKEFTQRMLLGQKVQVEICEEQPTDRYGRYLAFVYLTDRSGRRVLFNSELVRQGYARVYSLRPCTVDEDKWYAYYEEARAKRRGLFRVLGDVPDAAAYRRRTRRRSG